MRPYKSKRSVRGICGMPEKKPLVAALPSPPTWNRELDIEPVWKGRGVPSSVKVVFFNGPELIRPVKVAVLGKTFGSMTSAGNPRATWLGGPKFSTDLRQKLRAEQSPMPLSCSASAANRKC